jgi:hypothetical protein
MSSFENNFSTVVADFLNTNFVNPVSKFISEKYEELNGKNVDEITEMVREVLNLPIPSPVPAAQVSRSSSSQGVSSLAPTLVSGGMPSLANLGTIQKTDSVKRKGTKKEAPPPPAWLSIEEFKKAIADGGKICAYLSNRSKDPEKSNKVCAAAVEDTSNPDYRQWRCKACDGKKGSIETHIKVPVSGNDPTAKAMPGFNIPIMSSSETATIPMVPAPSALPPLPTMGSAMPNIPGLPTLSKKESPKMPEMPEIPKVPEAPKPVSPKTLEVPKAPEPAPAAVELPPIPVAKPMTPPTYRPKLDRHPGLKADVYIATNEDLKDIVIKVDRSGPKPTGEVIGKIPGLTLAPASADYESKLQELSQSEIDTVKLYRLNYNYLRPVALDIPDFGLPGIPGMPSIPGIPGL